MSPPSKSDRLDELIRDIEDTAEQVHQLLGELNDSKIDLAVLKIELKNIVACVSELSVIIKDKNHDGLGIIARLVIIENYIEEIRVFIESRKDTLIEVAVLQQKVCSLEVQVNKAYTTFENYHEAVRAKNNIDATAKTTGKWQMKIVMITGIFGIASTIIAFILQHC